MKLPSVLPDNILRRMSAADRKMLGKPGLLREELEHQWQAKNERELQKQIVNYLRLHGIEVNVSRTDKRTTHRKGWPDLTFAVEVENPETYRSALVVACAWEIKYGNGKLSPEQERLARSLTTPPNGWRFQVIRSLQEAKECLKELGIGDNY